MNHLPLEETRLTELLALLRQLDMPENPSSESLALINEALTHSSYKADYKGSSDYERLEFFGDSVLKFVVSEYLFKRFPEYSEGRLTEIRAVLVSGKTLDDLGTELGLGKYIILGRGIHLKTSMVGRSMEALFGAIYLSFGMEFAQKLINSLLAENVESIHLNAGQLNFKAQLQEYTQGLGKGTPTYSTFGVEGPPHAPVFTVLASVQGEVVSSGQGGSKKLAEQNAAEQALKKLKNLP